MFWGCHLTQEKAYKLSQDDESNLVHLSNAILVSGKKAALHAIIGEKEFVLGFMD